MQDRNEPAQRSNSLRAGERVLASLLDAMDGREPGAGHPSREFVRWKYRRPVVELQLAMPNGGTNTLFLASRNISRQGMSMLHSAFMYPGTACRVILRSADGTARPIRATVRRCEHRGGKVHEVGLQFEAEISLRDLIGLDPIDEGYSIETINPERLQGVLLVAAASEMEEQIIVRMLEQTALQIQVARDGATVKERVSKGCDLLLIDSTIGDGGNGVEVLSDLRAEGFDAPAVVLAAECSDMSRGAARMAGATGVIAKPVSQMRLLQAAAEFLMCDSDGGPIYSSLRPTDAAWDLIGKYLSEMPRLSLDLERAMREGDRAACERICRKLMSTAKPMGFSEVGDLAQRALAALGRSLHTREAGADLRALMIACRRVRYRAA